MGAIVCYDCLDDKSFDNAESWLSEFRTKSKEDSPIVLVATKKDKEVDSKVSPIKGENLASKFSARFI
jgi:GTPase SAR1 family protein